MEALVTGGAQGIGYQIVESLINDGISVTILTLIPKPLIKLRQDLAAKCSKSMSQSNQTSNKHYLNCTR